MQCCYHCHIDGGTLDTLPQHPLPSTTFSSFTVKAPHGRAILLSLKRCSKTFPAVLWSDIMVSEISYHLDPVTDFSDQNINLSTTVLMPVCQNNFMNVLNSGVICRVQSIKMFRSRKVGVQIILGIFLCF